MKRIQISEHSYCISDGTWCTVHALDNHCIVFMPVSRLKHYTVEDLDGTIYYYLLKLHAENMRPPQSYMGSDDLLHIPVNSWSYSPVLTRLVYAPWTTTKKELSDIIWLFQHTEGREFLAKPLEKVYDSHAFMGINYLTILPEEYRGYSEDYFMKYRNLYHATVYSDVAAERSVSNFLKGKKPYAKPSVCKSTLDEVLQNYTW